MDEPAATTAALPDAPGAWYLLVQHHPALPIVSVWLCRRLADDQGGTALLWGEMIPRLAEEIAAGLALPVAHEQGEGRTEAITPPGCADLPRQMELFR